MTMAVVGIPQKKTSPKWKRPGQALRVRQALAGLSPGKALRVKAEPGQDLMALANTIRSGLSKTEIGGKRIRTSLKPNKGLYLWLE